MNLGPKIAFVVGGVLLLSTTILAAVAVSEVGKVGTYLESSHQSVFLPYEQAEEVNDALERAEVALLAGIGSDPLQGVPQRPVLDRELRVVAAGIGNYEKKLRLASQDQMRTLLERAGVLDEQMARETNALRILDEGAPLLNAAIDSVQRLAARGDERASNATYTKVAAPLFHRAIAATAVLMAVQRERSKYASRAGHEVLQRTEESIALAVALAMLLAFTTVLWLTRQITNPLKALVEVTRAVSRGDLTQSVSVTTSDETGVLSSAFNQMIRDLRKEHNRSQRYLDTAEVILLMLDVEGRITLVNRYACSILGWTKEDLIGRDWMETCVPQRMRPFVRGKFGELLGGEASVVENTVLTRSGDERLVEWRNSLIRDEQGQVVGTLSSGTDITERSMAVEALRATEERMRFTLEAAGVGIWDRDYSSGVVRWSDIMEAQYGLQRGTFGGTIEAFYQAFHPEDVERVAKEVADAVRQPKEDGADFSVEHRAVLPDGTVRWMRSTGRVVLNERGEPVRGVGISEDITERRTLEAQYAQAQKMEAIGQLAGGVAHDFNNLLTAILGYCDLMLFDTAPNDPRKSDIEEIQKAGMSAASLTRQLLSFSRKQVIEPTSIDVNAVVSDMCAMAGRLLGADINVVVGLAPRLSLIEADRGQLEQVIMNLVVNARDAMPNGGTLTIQTANVELDEAYARTQLGAKPGSYVVLSVSDTGEGMTTEVQARLFEPFFTTKELGKGTGLGLATVDSVVMASGGYVEVASELGKGTSFRVHFPRAAGAELAEEAPAAVSAVRPHATEQTVLVVDDAEGLAELTKRLLEAQGYNVLVATSAGDALRLFDGPRKIDVLLTDVVMPSASGPVLTKQLVQRWPALKVIYMSGYTEEAITRHGVLNPGIDFLHKPFTSETLNKKIREVLDRVQVPAA